MNVAPVSIFHLSQFGWGLIWLMKRTHVELGGRTGHTGTRLREKVTWAEAWNLFFSALLLAKGGDGLGIGVQLAFWKRCLVHEPEQTPFPGIATYASLLPV